MSDSVDIFLPLVRIATMVAAVWLISQELPKQKHFALRAVAMVAVFAACSITIGNLRGSGTEPFASMDTLAWGLLTRAVVLALLTSMVLVCRQTSMWGAVFHASLGFTLQGMGESLFAAASMVLSPQMRESDLVLALILLACCSIVFALVGTTFVRAVNLSSVGAVEDDKLQAIFAGVIIVVIVLKQLVHALSASGADRRLIIALDLASAAICAFVLFAVYEVLYNSRLQAEAASVEQLLASKDEQYRISSASIRAIEARMHDIRHQIIRSMAQDEESSVSRELMAEVARDISIYDTKVRTGNDALDTALSEKRLLCDRQGIALTCIADGQAFAGMAPGETYLLFSNILDGAMQLEDDVEDAGMRTISLTSRAALGLVNVHVECTDSDGAAEPDLGEAQIVAERHGGTLTAERTGGSYCIDVVLPIEGSSR